MNGRQLNFSFNANGIIFVFFYFEPILWLLFDEIPFSGLEIKNVFGIDIHILTICFGHCSQSNFSFNFHLPQHIYRSHLHGLDTIYSFLFSLSIFFPIPFDWTFMNAWTLFSVCSPASLWVFITSYCIIIIIIFFPFKCFNFGIFWNSSEFIVIHLRFIYVFGMIRAGSFLFSHEF